MTFPLFSGNSLEVVHIGRVDRVSDHAKVVNLSRLLAALNNEHFYNWIVNIGVDHFWLK